MGNNNRNTNNNKRTYTTTSSSSPRQQRSTTTYTTTSSSSYPNGGGNSGKFRDPMDILRKHFGNDFNFDNDNDGETGDNDIVGMSQRIKTITLEDGVTKRKITETTYTR